MMALPERDTHRGDVMTIVQSQILNPSTLCWEANGNEIFAHDDIVYLLSEEGALEAAIESGALPGVSVRYCLVDPEGRISRVGRPASR
jgi:hypothetical protein